MSVRRTAAVELRELFGLPRKLYSGREMEGDLVSDLTRPGEVARRAMVDYAASRRDVAIDVAVRDAMEQVQRELSLGSLVRDVRAALAEETRG